MSPERRRRPKGRPRGESGASEAILKAARAQFAERGYLGATIRAIAGGAGVDPALVLHYYGSKEELFAAAMQLPMVPSQVISQTLAPSPDGRLEPGFGEHIVRAALTVWESTQIRGTFLGLLRSALENERAAAMLTEFISDSILTTLARAAGLAGQRPAQEAEYRVAMAASQMLGLALTRIVFGLPPMLQASVDEIAASIGPSVERYLSGDINLPERLAAQ